MPRLLLLLTLITTAHIVRAEDSGGPADAPAKLYARVALPRYAHTIDWDEQNRIHTVTAKAGEIDWGRPSETELMIELRAPDGALRSFSLRAEVVARHGMSFLDFKTLASDPNQMLAFVRDNWGGPEITGLVLPDQCHLNLTQ